MFNNEIELIRNALRGFRNAHFGCCTDNKEDIKTNMVTVGNQSYGSQSGKITQIILLCILMFCVVQLASPPAKADTLQQVLFANKIERGETTIDNLGKKITSHAVLNDGKYFCIAYYLDNGTNLIGDQLNIALLIKDQNKWIQRNLDFTKLLPDNSPFGPGSIMRISYSSNFFYLDTHINPPQGI